MMLFGAVRRLLSQQPCDSCDGTGCPCLYARDWYSMEAGCPCGCGSCGRKPAKRVAT